MTRARTGVFFRECRKAGRAARKYAAGRSSSVALTLAALAALFLIPLTWFHGW